MCIRDRYYGIGLAKGDTAGTYAINNALKELQTSGEFDALVDKNLGGDDAVDAGTPGDLSFIEQ